MTKKLQEPGQIVMYDNNGMPRYVSFTNGGNIRVTNKEQSSGFYNEEEAYSKFGNSMWNLRSAIIEDILYDSNGIPSLVKYRIERDDDEAGYQVIEVNFRKVN